MTIVNDGSAKLKNRLDHLTSLVWLNVYRLGAVNDRRDQSRTSWLRFRKLRARVGVAIGL
jgi:hypothetical protein